MDAGSPGARNAQQAQANIRVSELPVLSTATMAALRDIYARRIAQHVHHSW